MHATAASSKISLPVNNRKNTGNSSTERRATDPRGRTCSAKSRSGSFGRDRSHGRRRGLVRLSTVGLEYPLIARPLCLVLVSFYRIGVLLASKTAGDSRLTSPPPA